MVRSVLRTVLFGSVFFLVCCGRSVPDTAAVHSPPQIQTPAQSAPSATLVPSDRPALQPSIQTSSGVISLGMPRSTIATILGQPDTEGIVHGQGGTEWTYQSGITIDFWDNTADSPAASLLITPPFDGSTREGFGLGDSQTKFKEVYRENKLLVTAANQYQITIARGISLITQFDEQGQAVAIHYVQDAP